ncbi:MAG TPA: immunity 22 family protein [Pseudomonadales bacterium]|nr:immunity 22 family protein [Pseudomonadales bacterium]
MKTQQEFEASGMVSVWVGDFLTDVQFDKYMNLTEDFEKDFGFKIHDRGIRECVVENRSKPIAQLAEGFSSWTSFVAAVAEVARKMGVDQATTMIVFYCVKYDPSRTIINSNAPLKFIGAFPFA